MIKLIVIQLYMINSIKILFITDLKVYVVDSKFRAGWEKSAKKHLMY